MPHENWLELNYLLLFIIVFLSFLDLDIRLLDLIVFGFFVQKFLELMNRSFMGTFVQGEILKELLQVCFMESAKLELKV